MCSPLVQFIHRISRVLKREARDSQFAGDVRPEIISQQTLKKLQDFEKYFKAFLPNSMKGFEFKK